MLNLTEANQMSFDRITSIIERLRTEYNILVNQSSVTMSDNGPVITLSIPGFTICYDMLLDNAAIKMSGFLFGVYYIDNI